ncbi:MAG: hypothetical protein KAS36_00770 [Anaerolineales bacterium]|nr:hypothetical protein [Anaerolineales bacterium]
MSNGVGVCTCNIAGAFDIEYDGIISASMSAGTDIKLTADEIILVGPTLGTINIQAYPYPPNPATNLERTLGVRCPTKVQAQISWVRRYDCDNNIYYFIPQRGGTASIEGETPDGISFEQGPFLGYRSFSASASSGPATVYLDTTHYDGFNLIYTGSPIPFESGRPEPMNILASKLPAGVELYLQSFSMDITPPHNSTVSYSFAFVYNLP